jgi:hypothetical protein
MNLFMAAGIDLPSSGSGGKRPATRLARTPLFVPKTVQAALASKAIDPSEQQRQLAAKYARNIKSAGFRKQKETAVRNAFFDEILKGVLGYRGVSGDEEYSLAFEHPILGRSVDAALGRFSPSGEGQVVAPFEMKGPDTSDLDRIMAGRGISPVEQAWNYASAIPGANWVLVSNCLEIRLYRFGRGRETYEHFDLSRLDDPEQLARFILLLDARRFVEGGTEELLEQSDAALKSVTDELYEQYSALRGKLVGFLAHEADGPRLSLPQAIEAAQKLLDRVIFIAFACGNGMLPKTIFQRAVNQKDDFDPKPVWQNVNRLFRWVDTGNSSSNPALDVWPYNGGLFAEDPVADRIILPDYLAEQMATLLGWDYGEEISVNVLGHIFEQSITDLEQLREGEPAPVSRRKREGVVYTPDHIARFLVEQTIAKTLAERFDACLEAHTGHRGPDAEGRYEWTEDQERAVWTDYLAALRSLTVVDPACGSGAFLVAAFDALAAEYRRVTQRLDDLGVETIFDVYDEILSNNLYGVDLNVESVEIARLALWLKTARRKHRLLKLDETIRSGDSLIDDPKASSRPFDWRAAFPEVFAAGGFDIVIGNPPYVRMEHLKAVKPWLAKTFTVADERTDLSAYFFEKGVSLLKPGGRLGYISTSSFFRAGYGEKLRLLLSEYTDVETVVDFGDVQIFEGVTTYPAILTARKKAEIGAPAGELSFLNIDDSLPADLARQFGEKAAPMLRSRLTGASWQFERDALARLRDKIVGGRKTLKEAYGPPLYGIKTGLNDAFIVDTPTRDRLVAADPKSAELLKPFLKGENIKRWRVEPEGLWLINTPKGKVDIDNYPAIRDWLLPFKDRLEARATEQEWWELQQAQLAYQPKLEQSKIAWPHFQDKPSFALDNDKYYLNNKCFFLPAGDRSLLAFLNSSVGWWHLRSIARIKRGGYIEAEAQFVEQIAIPSLSTQTSSDLARLVDGTLHNKTSRNRVSSTFRHRLLTDLASPGARLSRKLESFHDLSFADFRAEVKRALKAEIPVRERGQWEALHAEASTEIRRLNAEIAAAESEIDRLVYAAFELNPDEIALLEKSLEE